MIARWYKALTMTESSLTTAQVQIELVASEEVAAELRLCGRVLADIWKQGVQIEVS